MKTRTPWALGIGASAILAFGLVAAACGNDDDIDDLFDGDLPTLPVNGDDEPNGNGEEFNGNDDMNGNGGADVGVTVSISMFTFSPATIDVMAGTTITFVNDDEVPHTVTVNGTTEGELAAGDSIDVTFDAPGEYQITCDFHPDMSATVIVS
jgi:plastocyanin